MEFINKTFTGLTIYQQTKFDSSNQSHTSDATYILIYILTCHPPYSYYHMIDYLKCCFSFCGIFLSLEMSRILQGFGDNYIT